jgi:alpha-L-rhamnosidase
MQAARTLIEHDPFLPLNKGKSWRETGLWPCFWVSCPNAGEPPFVTAYRLWFTVESDAQIRVHITADERYELYLDGERIGQGSERGAPHHWFYETYDLSLPVGSHLLVARVWTLGSRGAIAQMSAHPGFLLAAEGDWMEKLSTGIAAWETKRLDGYSLLSAAPSHWRAATIQLDGNQYPWRVEHGEGDGWQPAEKGHPGVGRLVDWEFHQQHLLYPAMLPPMLHEPRQIGRVRSVTAPASAEVNDIPLRVQDLLSNECEPWQALVEGRSEVVIPSHSIRRVIIDLENYYCAYTQTTVSGGRGSTVRILWAEALYDKPGGGRKGHRDEIEGRYFIGRGDGFLPDGGERRTFRPVWWEAGRYLQLMIQTSDEALTLNQFTLFETRYPLDMESQFTASDPRLESIIPLTVRGMQMDAHETYADSPYYEELMYAGDTRLEILTTFVMTRDVRLPRKAITMFDESRVASGLVQARYPSRQLQIIAPFALWWVGMVHDYALWRDADFARQFLPGVRAAIEAFGRYMGKDGLLHAPDGWNVSDWVRAWDGGIPPGGVDGISGLLNWHLVYGLNLASDLERWLGEPELAQRCHRWADDLAARLIPIFWDEDRGLLADDIEHQHFSEHTQCLALLSGRVNASYIPHIAEGLLNDPSLERTTIYFSHYLFETYRLLERPDALLARLPLWFDLVNNGLKTPVESPEPTRSDCHAWGSHPLFHYFATILGIRPASLGFRTVVIKPQLGALTHAGGTLVHPLGEISVDFHRDGDMLHGSVNLPAGVIGTLYRNGHAHALNGNLIF